MNTKETSTFGTYLETFKALTSPETTELPAKPRDPVFTIIDTAASSPVRVVDLIDKYKFAAGDVESAMTKLQNLEAIEIAGHGLSQSISLTAKGHELRSLFSA